MRPALALLALGWLAALVQGGAAQLLPPRAVPDLALLLTLAAGLALGPGWALVLAAGVGLGADMVSGTLLGQLAFLRLLELVFVRAVAGQLDLRRGLPLAVFAFALVLIDGLGQVATSRLFLGSFPFQASELLALAGRAAITAPLAPAVGALVRSVRARLDEGEARRNMRLDTRRTMLR
jgi:cell shape-determining protein MreD